jgi:hypothetical protein
MRNQCDLYVYDDVSGCLTIHVASRRMEPISKTIQDPLEWLVERGEEKVNAEDWHHIYGQWNDAMEKAEWIDRTGDYAGETFHITDKDDLHDLLVGMRADGLIFPEDLEAWILEDWAYS